MDFVTIIAVTTLFILAVVSIATMILHILEDDHHDVEDPFDRMYLVRHGNLIETEDRL